MPQKIKTRAISKLRSTPSRFECLAKRAKAAKINTGNEVSNPPAEGLSFKSKEITSSSGPTPVMGVRKTEAISITPIRMIYLFFRLVGLEFKVLSCTALKALSKVNVFMNINQNAIEQAPIRGFIIN